MPRPFILMAALAAAPLAGQQAATGLRTWTLPAEPTSTSGTIAKPRRRSTAYAVSGDRLYEMGPSSILAVRRDADGFEHVVEYSRIR